MKTIFQQLLMVAVVLLGILPVAAQNKIALSHSGVSSFYTDLSSAITASVNGDTLYLPGGPIQPSATITVSKSLHFVGTGHYPDSTIATYRTVIQDLRFLTGSGGGSIEGCVINTLYIGFAATQNITGFSVKRCSVGVFRLGSDNVSTFESISLTDNVFSNYFFINGGYPNMLISRNFFSNSNNMSIQGLLVNNNIIYFAGSPALQGIISCTIENNILICSGGGFHVGSDGCIFNNNLMIPNVYTWGNNTQANSILGQTTANTFVNANGTNFDYSYNYHLLSSSPGKNYGTDGTDVGIYGTSTPYKDGAVPFNPHIMSKSISGQLTSTGVLNVNVSVSAQDF